MPVGYHNHNHVLILISERRRHPFLQTNKRRHATHNKARTCFASLISSIVVKRKSSSQEKQSHSLSFPLSFLLFKHRLIFSQVPTPFLLQPKLTTQLFPSRHLLIRISILAAPRTQSPLLLLHRRAWCASNSFAHFAITKDRSRASTTLFFDGEQTTRTFVVGAAV